MDIDPRQIDPRQQVLARVRDLSAVHSEMGRSFARDQQMHDTDALAVVSIVAAEKNGRPLTPARLAERISLTTGATSILLNRLEKAGHVIRTRESSDRRMVTLRATPGVREAAAGYFEPLAARMVAALGDYSPADLELIDTALSRLHAVMREYTEGERS
ncbi:MarR family winged helix-turn-helix transcriptional regulator [Actinoplanes sp. G11-F43]|uniref:MarR family winged helix-turn-helix transcriptional regulator n=1 Tax=Actinoplanes sp. G11-F43 TaxID=3424130 RepID=UPI003D32EC38